MICKDVLWKIMINSVVQEYCFTQHTNFQPFKKCFIYNDSLIIVKGSIHFDTFIVGAAPIY